MPKPRIIALRRPEMQETSGHAALEAGGKPAGDLLSQEEALRELGSTESAFTE